MHFSRNVFFEQQFRHVQFFHCMFSDLNFASLELFSVAVQHDLGGGLLVEHLTPNRTGLEPHSGHHVVSLSKTHKLPRVLTLIPQSTG